jgi:hypothetical protein
MKIVPKELSYIRQGLANLLLNLKINKERKSLTDIQNLLDRLDEMEKNFYASHIVPSGTKSE